MCKEHRFDRDALVQSVVRPRPSGHLHSECVPGQVLGLAVSGGVEARGAAWLRCVAKPVYEWWHLSVA